MKTRCVDSMATGRPSIAAMQLAFAICVALVVLNLYSSQVLIVPITASYGMPEGATGFVSTAAGGSSAGVTSASPSPSVSTSDSDSGRHLPVICPSSA